MNQRVPLGLILLSTVVMLVAYGSAFVPGSAPKWAPWLLAIAVSTMLLGMLVLGAASGARRIGILWLPFLLVYLILLAGFGLALLLPPESTGAPSLILGLPRRAALLVYGIGLIPSLILPVAYARSFDALTLRPEDLERIREARARQEPG